MFLQIITTITKKSASITIKHVESLDCGIYTCKLHNSVSDVSVDFKLAVIGEILILPWQIIFSNLLQIFRQTLPTTRTSQGDLEDRRHSLYRMD